MYSCRAPSARTQRGKGSVKMGPFLGCWLEDFADVRVAEARCVPSFICVPASVPCQVLVGLHERLIHSASEQPYV